MTVRLPVAERAGASNAPAVSVIDRSLPALVAPSVKSLAARVRLWPAVTLVAVRVPVWALRSISPAVALGALTTPRIAPKDETLISPPVEVRDPVLARPAEVMRR